MIPLSLDPSHVSVALVGAGPLALRRLELLQDGGAEPHVYASAPDAALRQAARGPVEERMPDMADLHGVRVLFVAGVELDRAEPLAAAARAAGLLVNVEDVPRLCDFHVPARVRRGDLLVTVSTAGRSPSLASVLRRRLEGIFPAEWAGRMNELADLRRRLRDGGADAASVNRATDAMIDEKGWL